MIQRLILIALFVFSIAKADAVTYYVRNGGSDGATGTSDAAAWATISKVNSSVSGAGDYIGVVHLATGLLLAPIMKMVLSE